jgi:hypothetical protein
VVGGIALLIQALDRLREDTPSGAPANERHFGLRRPLVWCRHVIEHRVHLARALVNHRLIAVVRRPLGLGGRRIPPGCCRQKLTPSPATPPMPMIRSGSTLMFSISCGPLSVEIPVWAVQTQRSHRPFVVDLARSIRQPSCAVNPDTPENEDRESRRTEAIQPCTPPYGWPVRIERRPYSRRFMRTFSVDAARFSEVYPITQRHGNNL